jgi:hypothetical protein
VKTKKTKIIVIECDRTPPCRNLIKVGPYASCVSGGIIAGGGWRTQRGSRGEKEAHDETMSPTEDWEE